jgi:hypothetical protein
VLVLAGGLFAYTVTHRAETEVIVARIQGPSFIELPDGRISSQARIRLENKTDTERRYHLYLTDSPGAALRGSPTWTVAPRKSSEVPLFVDVPRDSFHDGKRHVYLHVHDSAGFERVVRLTLLGPEAENHHADGHHREDDDD